MQNKNKKEPFMDKLQQEIEQVFRDAESIWDSQEYGNLKTLWDEKDPYPFYLAEEQANWKIGWHALKTYWEPIPGKRMIEAIRMRFYDIKIKELSQDLVFIGGWVRHDMKIRGPMKAWGGDARMSAVLRKKEAGWKFVAYTESHRTPLTYMMDLYKKQPSIPIVRTIVQRFMTRLYEKNVHPEFAAFHKNIMETEKTEYKVNFWTKLSFIGPKIINSFAKITGKKTIPKSYIPGLIPCLNGRGFMEKDLNGISVRFVDESAKIGGISLDVGCAYGIATLAALKGGSEVVACDMDQAHLDILLKETPEKDKPRLTTKKGTLPGVDFKNQSFVAIHCSRCLHFLVPEELKLTLEKMYNWLQPGGKIYLITDTCFSGPWKKYLPEFDRRKAEGDPFPGFIEDALKCLPVSKLPKGMTPHMNCLDPDTLARECKLAGFEIIEADFLGPARSEAKYAKDHAGIIAIKN